MTRPSAIQILELAELAKSDEAFRLVLHDALLERYGRSYESLVEAAREMAQRSGRSVAVALDPIVLGEMEMKSGSRINLRGWGAVWLVPEPFDIATSRSIEVLTVSPPAAGRGRRRRTPGRRR